MAGNPPTNRRPAHRQFHGSKCLDFAHPPGLSGRDVARRTPPAAYTERRTKLRESLDRLETKLAPDAAEAPALGMNPLSGHSDVKVAEPVQRGSIR